MKHVVSELILDNGAKGLLIHVPGASVMDININFRAGDFTAEKEKWETPHIMEHLLLGANKKIPNGQQYNAEFEKNGAYQNASTDMYHVTYESECADFEWNRILQLLVNAVSAPIFLRSEYKAQFGNVRDELTSYTNDYWRHLDGYLGGKFGVYLTTDSKRLKLMDNVSLRDIKEHYQKTHSTMQSSSCLGIHKKKSRSH